MITLTKRIELYEQAIKDWRTNNDKRDLSSLCFYFWDVNIDIEDLPEIKPLARHKKSAPFWFPVHRATPRIKILEVALAEAKARSSKKTAAKKKPVKKAPINKRKQSTFKR